MTRVYYREAVGALVVFDVTRASTFDAVLKWKDDLDSKVELDVPAQANQRLRTRIMKHQTAKTKTTKKMSQTTQMVLFMR